MLKRSLAMLSLLAVAGAAHGQEFVNGDFETMDFTGWTITPTFNGVTRVQNVEPFELVQGQPPVFAAHFAVGNETFISGHEAGIEMTQDMNLTAGTAYNFGFNWAAIRLAGGNNADGGVFSLIVDGNPLVTVSSGTVSSTEWHYGRIDEQFIPTVTGPHSVGVRITRRFTVPATMELRQIVGNFTPSASASVCYANCDSSTTEPILNVDDFTCFINEFAAAQALPHEQQVEHYANCDGSTTAPVLNVDDFTCFINAFAAGCP